MKIAIVGGGIAGLTAALCLHAKGFSPEVYEQAARFNEVGAGLQLGPNAVKVLRAVGLGEALLAAAQAPEALTIRSGYAGAVMTRLPLGDAAARWGAPYFHIHRADLIAVLADALNARAIKTHMNAHLAGVEQVGDSAALRFDDGRSLTADIVIGADGLRSQVRAQVFKDDGPRFTGCNAWRAVVPVKALGRHKLPADATVWTGRGRHAVTYLLRGGQLANFVGVLDAQASAPQSWSREGSAQQALADFRGFDPAILKLIRAADTLHQWGIYERGALDHYSKSRAMVIGDACHAMPPFLAQGAAMAIEDAYCLAQSLEQQSEHSAAFADYQEKRQGRVARVIQTSHANKDRFHLRSAAMRMGAFGAMRAADRLLKPQLLKQLDWLYGYDVTAP